MMPTRIDFTSGWERSGIDITWYKTSRELAIHGWYDSQVGIEGERMGLRDFFDRLGITSKDCEKVFTDAK